MKKIEYLKICVADIFNGVLWEETYSDSNKQDIVYNTTRGDLMPISEKEITIKPNSDLKSSPRKINLIKLIGHFGERGWILSEISSLHSTNLYDAIFWRKYRRNK